MFNIEGGENAFALRDRIKEKDSLSHPGPDGCSGDYQLRLRLLGTSQYSASEP